MKNIFITNGHEKYDFSPGELNGTLVEKATKFFTDKNCNVKHTNMTDHIDVQIELEKHKWADLIILQSPVNWTMVSWSFKKYIDQVYSAGMGGDLSVGDGRSKDAPTKNYGTSGCLNGKKYMLSLTLNAPKEAFNDPNEYLFQGKSLDDLFISIHMNFRFFAMTPLPTFACYDVIKNPQIKNDLKRFEEHLDLIYSCM